MEYLSPGDCGPLKMYSVQASELRTGDILYWNNDLFLVTRTYSITSSNMQAVDYEDGDEDGGGRFYLKLTEELMIHRGKE